jgi:hypothetical protein
MRMGTIDDPSLSLGIEQSGSEDPPLHRSKSGHYNSRSSHYNGKNCANDSGMLAGCHFAIEATRLTIRPCGMSTRDSLVASVVYENPKKRTTLP